MARERFYEISEAAYLFPDIIRNAGIGKRMEEAVRQWCAYELMRAYGIKISEIEFERPVKVGSKQYRIDILVSCRGVPAVVVECKHREFIKHTEAITQAISYADSQNIRAEFVVYTNGAEWYVKRRIREKWVGVIDLPFWIDESGAVPVTELLRALSLANPLLGNLHDSLGGTDARTFLGAMQQFFCGTNLLNVDINKNLSAAVDNLLRSLGAAGDTPYQNGKFNAARSYFEQYRKQADVGTEIVAGQDSLWREMQYLYGALLNIVEGTTGMAVGDLLVLRLATALLDYGRSLREVKKPASYPPIGPKVQQPLHDYLQAALLLNLNMSLPDQLDKTSISDLQGYCRSAWEELKAGE